MTLDEIIEKCDTLNIREERYVSDDYAERVFYSKEINKWHKVFSDLLGPPIKPAGSKPTKEHINLTEDYGGIYDNQTLFRKEFDSVCVVVMFWPWQDNTHTTLKIIFLKK